MPGDSNPTPTSTERPQVGWESGTRWRGTTLEVRDRWQGLFGPNAWLTVFLALGVAVVPGWWRLAPLAALVAVALCCYPVAHFGPETVQWRNRFVRQSIPTAMIQRLTVENFNPRAWVPAVAAETRRGGSGTRSVHFVATFSYRKSVAQRIATEVQAWASEQEIPATGVNPDLMHWRFAEPRR